MKRVLQWSGMVASALAVTGLVWAGTNVVTAMGKVTDAEDNPIAGATVRFTHTKNDLLKYETKTDKKGRWNIPNLLYTQNEEDWNYEAEAEGYVPSSVHVECRTPSRVVVNEEIKLRRGKKTTVNIPGLGRARLEFVMVPESEAEALEVVQAPGVPPLDESPSKPVVAAPSPLQLAAEKLREGDYEGSVEFFRKALEDDPDQPEVCEDFAKVLFRLERHDEAEVQAKRAADLAPDRPGPHRILASIYAALGDHPKAVEALRKEQELSPNDPKLLEFAAQLADEMGDTEGALAANEALVRINPDHVRAWISLGEIYASKKQMAKSEEAFQKVVELDPENAYQTFYNIGALIMNKPRASQAEVRKAVEAFRRAVEIKPDYAAAHRQLGFAQLNVGDLAGARRSLERYLELTPKAGDAQEVRDMVLALPKG